jgi:hypothetical protein
MRGPGLPSIDQLTVFLSVVETGSFRRGGPQAWTGDVSDQLYDRPRHCC